jgi:membrane protein
VLGVVERVQGGARTRWGRQKERRPWLDHLARACRRYKGNNGDQLAAGITYFSFLALFPMILLAISIAGFVLASHQNLVNDLKNTITLNVPGPVGTSVKSVIDASLSRRGTIGVVGLLGVAYAGLGWIGNLRTGIQVVWNCRTVSENPVKSKLEDLLALVGLGLGILISLSLTTGGTAAAHKLIQLAGLDGTPGLGTAAAVVGIVLAVAADTGVFLWLFIRLPRRPVRMRSVLRGALFGAVGYELLKVVAAFYLSRVGANGAYGAFAGIVGLLIWIDLVSRFLLFSAAWTATAPQPPGAEACTDGDPPS